VDYNTLIAASTSAGSISSWVNHTAAQAAAPTIIAEAESAIYRRLRHWQMLTSTSGTATTSAAAVALPSDYLKDKLWKFTGTQAADLTRKTIQEVVQAWSYDSTGARATGQPQIFSNDKSNIVFDAVCDKAYPFTLYYYQQPLALSGTNTTNFLTTTYPRLMRCACMVGASEFMKDAGQGNFDRTYWAQMTQIELDEAQRESDNQESSMELGMILK
jgi:hypothetical protein